MRDALKECLAQAGTTALPHVHVERRLRVKSVSLDLECGDEFDLIRYAMLPDRVRGKPSEYIQQVQLSRVNLPVLDPSPAH